MSIQQANLLGCFINRVEWYVDSDYRHIKRLAERHVYCIFHWEYFRNNISLRDNTL